MTEFNMPDGAHDYQHETGHIEDPPASAIGIYYKFDVTRTDGRDAVGERHFGCKYFVLDLDHDRFAQPALLAYADACEELYPALAADLRLKISALRLSEGR